MRARFRQAAEVGIIAVLGHGVATFSLVQEDRMAPAEFGAGLFVVLIFVTVAWFTLLSLREKAR
jgi:predicted amidohydrolase